MMTLEKLQERPLSYSSLKEFAKSPKHFVAYLNKERKSTPAMELGSLIHCLLLQPEDFHLNYSIMPNVDRRTKEGKATYEDFLSKSEGKVVITESDYTNAFDMAENARSNPSIAQAINSCKSFEKEWRIDVGGIPVRGFFDGEADDYILEVKTATDAEPRTIINDFYKRMYHIQAGLYNLASNKPVLYLVIETSSPFNSYLAWAKDDYVDQGKKIALDLIEGFKHCMKDAGFDKGYEYYNGAVSIGLPGWVK